MVKFKNTEGLLAWIIDFFAIRFSSSAIIKGGMSLRLLHSPRYTNDVDYVFIPFDSKKSVQSLVEQALDSIEGLQYKTSLNSKAMRILICYGGMEAQVEISVEKECPSIPISSSLLSSFNGLPSRIVRIMEPTISFAHKIAAWNERELLRDLFDIYQYESVFCVQPNTTTLVFRLKNARSYKNIIAAKNVNDLCIKLQNSVKKLDENSLTELKPIIEPNELVGLSYRIKPSIIELCNKLKNLDDF